MALSLVAAGHQVYALYRSASRASRTDVYQQLEAAGITLIAGDISDEESLHSVFRQLHPVTAVVSAVTGAA